MTALVQVAVPVLAALFVAWVAYLIGARSGEKIGAENERREARLRARASVKFDEYVAENRIEP